MTSDRTMVLEMSTGRTRPMRRSTPVCSSSRKHWDGFLVEEHPPAEWESHNVSLLSNAIYLTLNDETDLEWKSGGKTVSRRLGPGRVSILPANHPYSVRLRASGGSIVVSLEQKVLSCAAAEQAFFGDVQPVWVHGVDDALLRELVMALRGEVRGPERNHPGYAQSLASTLAAHVVKRYSSDRLQMPECTGGLAAAALRVSIRFIQDHLEEEITIDTLAAQVNLSAAHFSRMFKRSTGLSPHRYVLQSRIARARQLLMNRALTLADVATMAGFCDQGHMTRSFRQILGTTPGAYSRTVWQRYR